MPWHTVPYSTKEWRVIFPQVLGSTWGKIWLYVPLTASNKAQQQIYEPKLIVRKLTQNCLAEEQFNIDVQKEQQQGKWWYIFHQQGENCTEVGEYTYTVSILQFTVKFTIGRFCRLFTSNIFSFFQGTTLRSAHKITKERKARGRGPGGKLETKESSRRKRTVMQAIVPVLWSSRTKNAEQIHKSWDSRPGDSCGPGLGWGMGCRAVRKTWENHSN